MFGDYETRIVVGDEQRRFAGELCNGVLRIAFVALQVENVTNATL
jgi:hypothetical protein